MTLAHNIHQSSRTQDVQISHNITFDAMLLAPETLEGLKNAGFYKPSPIQLHGIPLGKCGFDLLLEAKSGTGKTAVFTLIALEKIDLKKGLQVVILAPTREIAAQICDVIKQIGSGYNGLAVEVVMGGLPVHEDIAKFKRNVHIVVGSPGRLRHLLEDQHIDASSVRLLVLDEADKLMEKSFQEDVKYIFSLLPTQKQVIMSSATYSDTEKLFIEKYVQNAQHVRPNSNCVLLGVDQKLSLVKYNINIVKQTQIRFQEVLKIFSKMQFKQCLIFCNYQVRVSELHRLLLHAKWPAEQLSGNQEQAHRLDALKTLQEYKCRILIATDLAARGIDASNIDLVINFEPPHEWQTYLHRIGRAGRYGSYGMAITLLSEGVEAKKFHKMLEPVRETINLTNLWNNGEISALKGFSPKVHSLNTDENFETFQVNNEISKELKELWKVLAANEETKNNNELENFENLCASFDKSNSDIETFDELLQSFQNDQIHKDTDLQFKHLNISSGPCKYFCVLKKHFNIIGKQEEENNNISKTCSKKPELINVQEKENKINNVNVSRKHNNIKSTSCENGHSNLIKNINNDDHIIKSTDDMTQFNIAVKQSTSHKSKGLCNEETAADLSSKRNDINLISTNNGLSHLIENEENNIDMISNNFDIQNAMEKNYDTKQALLDAGLPTEFGKSKINKNLQYCTNKSRPKKISSVTQNERSFSSDLLEIQSSSSCRNIISSDQKSKSGKYYKKQMNSYDMEDNYLNNNHKQKLKCKSKKYTGATRSSDNISENYATWYRNLKFQTKQIEIAVYVDELSKL